MSQDEVRLAMVPTLARTLGVKGHRPTVDTRDDKDLLYVFGAVNCLSGQLHTRTLESRHNQRRRDRRRGGPVKTNHLQHAFVAHLRDLARRYPADQYSRVVLIVDNAPWHKGLPVQQALAEHPHLELYRLPGYSPQLNVIERLWKLLRWRVTHNRLFENLTALRASIGRRLRQFQRVPSRILSLIQAPYSSPPDATASGGA